MDSVIFDLKGLYNEIGKIKTNIKERRVVRRQQKIDRSNPIWISLPDNEPSGRNKPCPCGSGKKYKKCCLK